MDPGFSSLVLGTVIVLFLVTLVITVLFMRRLACCVKAPAGVDAPQSSYEQKWTVLILISAICFDNPFLALQYAVHGWFFAALQVREGRKGE